MYHQPVLLKESIDLLSIVQEGTYVDATFGGGGHAKLMLERIGNGRVVAFDQDVDAKNNALRDERFTFIQNNFRFLENFLGFYKLIPVDGILADLGISSHQIDTPGRGFSYQFPDEPLDMRMNIAEKKTAAEILNTYPDELLATVFFKFGELLFSRKLAAAIVQKRANAKFSKVSDLTEVLDKFTSPFRKFSMYSKAFQALRIEVNQEMQALEEFLEQSLRVLKSGGRMVVISYHSLEDRMVKNFFRSGRTDGVVEKDFYGNSKKVFDIMTSKPLVPTEVEISANPRARSAKLRAAIKI